MRALHKFVTVSLLSSLLVFAKEENLSQPINKDCIKVDNLQEVGPKTGSQFNSISSLTETQLTEDLQIYGFKVCIDNEEQRVIGLQFVAK